MPKRSSKAEVRRLRAGIRRLLKRFPYLTGWEDKQGYDVVEDYNELRDRLFRLVGDPIDGTEEAEPENPG